MALRPILADRLPLALPHAQPANELWSNQQAQKQRRRHRRSRAEAEIANKVEDSFKFQSLREQIQHKITFPVTPADDNENKHLVAPHLDRKIDFTLVPHIMKSTQQSIP